MMRKLIFTLALVAASYATAQAQASFGVRGGANLSNLSGDLRNESLYENKASFHAGATLNFPIVPNFFSIQPEVLYSRKGFKTSGVEFTDVLGQTRRREGAVNYNYIDVPLLANIKAGPLYFELGPQASYLLSVNNETKVYDGQNTLLTTTRDMKSKDGLQEFEVGYAAGVGFVSRNGISFGARYNGAFSDFVKEDVNFDGDLTNARHSVFMLTLGFRFNGGR